MSDINILMILFKYFSQPYDNEYSDSKAQMENIYQKNKRKMQKHRLPEQPSRTFSSTEIKNNLKLLFREEIKRAQAKAQICCNWKRYYLNYG